MLLFHLFWPHEVGTKVLWLISSWDGRIVTILLLLSAVTEERMFNNNSVVSAVWFISSEDLRRDNRTSDCNSEVPLAVLIFGSTNEARKSSDVLSATIKGRYLMSSQSLTWRKKTVDKVMMVHCFCTKEELLLSYFGYTCTYVPTCVTTQKLYLRWLSVDSTTATRLISSLRSQIEVP